MVTRRSQTAGRRGGRPIGTRGKNSRGTGRGESKKTEAEEKPDPYLYSQGSRRWLQKESEEEEDGSCGKEMPSAEA